MAPPPMSSCRFAPESLFLAWYRQQLLVDSISAVLFPGPRLHVRKAIRSRPSSRPPTLRQPSHTSIAGFVDPFSSERDSLDKWLYHDAFLPSASTTMRFPFVLRELRAQSSFFRLLPPFVVGLFFWSTNPIPLFRADQRLLFPLRTALNFYLRKVFPSAPPFFRPR